MRNSDWCYVVEHSTNFFISNILHLSLNMLRCLYYGSTNEAYKIAYEKQAFASCT